LAVAGFPRPTIPWQAAVPSGQLVAEVKEPLRRALARLRPLLADIEADWRGQLGRIAPCADEREALSGLVSGHGRYLAAGDLQAFTLDLAQQGQVLASRGVAEEHALLALALYFELGLPHLLRQAPGRSDLAIALARLVSAGQLSVLSGYATVRATGGHGLGSGARRRLAQDLHDEFGSLAVLKCSLEQTAVSLKRGRTRQAGRRLEETAALVTDTIESVRRVILDLAPAVLDELGLPRAMRLAARQFAARTGIEVRLRTRGVPDRLPHGHETALYRVLQGALSNVLRHSRARRAVVTLAMAPGPTVVMVVADRGVGFAPRARGAAGSFGLDAMRERVEDLGGQLTVQSWPAREHRRRHGTRIEVRLPLPADARW
jgi:two-component sensor histidine kinase